MRLALALLSTSLLSGVPVQAAETVGSGVVPSTAANSAERPIRIAENADAGGVLVLVMEGATLPETPGLTLSAEERATVERAIAANGFKGKSGASLAIHGLAARPQLLLVGAVPSAGESRALALQGAAGEAAQDLRGVDAPVTIAGALAGRDLADLAFGYSLGQYRFDRYRRTDHSAPPARPVTIVGRDAAAARALWDGRYAASAEGVRLARDLANEPANVIYPESFVDRVRAAFSGTAGVTVEELDESAMRSLGMGSVVGVGQGSRRGSRMMIVHYRGADAGAPLALVGKGITFDSGGISIKPGAGMWEMKGDMSGAAAVMGATLSLAKSKAPVNVVAVAALAENMPGGNAQRPGDVVRTMSGKTIEVINTDAEGRLVLADANEYVAARYRPAAIVNIATLTGAISTALGDDYAGLFARDETLAAALSAAGSSSGEPVWRMPLHPDYAETMKSDVADIKNSAEGASAGAGLGAHFIGYFVDPALPWAHIDMAGVDRTSTSSPLVPKGATGYGVRLLDAAARNWGK